MTDSLLPHQKRSAVLSAFLTEHLLVDDSIHGASFAQSNTPPHGWYLRVSVEKEETLSTLIKSYRGYPVIGEVRSVPHILLHPVQTK